MVVCYIVYREDNVMVFDSQVLQYLSELRKQEEVTHIELIVFRHQDHLRQKKQVEEKILKYVDSTKTFASFPVLSQIQLNLNARRLKAYVKRRYGKTESIAVICRGELATYVGHKAFLGHPNSRVLFDNRGLPLEESMMRYKHSRIHRINRKNKRRALVYAKDHCDMMNFVTNDMRRYLIDTYAYDATRPYTVIPTLFRPESLDDAEWREVASAEHYSTGQLVVSYIGSTASWQSTTQLIDTIQKIGERYGEARFFVLTNGTISDIEQLPDGLRQRITVKSVQHRLMKYYLKMSSFGIVIREDHIVNQVAAPTKIAEYLTAGVVMLYAGHIGILNDISEQTKNSPLLSIDEQPDWLDRMDSLRSLRNYPVHESIIQYFDMTVRQRETIRMIECVFEKEKQK